MDKKSIWSEFEIESNGGYRFQEMYANNILSGRVNGK